MDAVLLHQTRLNYSRILFTVSASPPLFFPPLFFMPLRLYGYMYNLSLYHCFFLVWQIEILSLCRNTCAQYKCRWFSRNGSESVGRRHRHLPPTRLPPLGHPLLSLLPSLVRDMSEFPDYYAILSIPRTATTEEVRSAYKRESLRYAAAPGSLIVLGSL